MGDWKLVLNGQHTVLNGEDPKMLANVKVEQVELFHLLDDVGESKNLAAEQPVVVAKLRKRYDELAAEAVSPKARPRSRGFKNPKVWGQSETTE